MSLMILRERRNGYVDLLIVLDDDSVARIREHDPFEMLWPQLPANYAMRRPACIGVVWASNEDQARLVELAQQGKNEEAMHWATRGFKFQPERGDHDFGPTVLGKPTGGTKQ